MRSPTSTANHWRASVASDRRPLTDRSRKTSRERSPQINAWQITELDLKPHSPAILSSTEDARAITLMIPAGESLDDHQVHERAWVTVLAGEVEVSSGTDTITGGPGLVLEFAPNERHAVHARSETRLLLLLAPWPGAGHPGTLSLEQKANARSDAAKRAQSPMPGETNQP